MAFLDAESFVRSVGVNVHISWTKGPYTDTSKVIQGMDYLGLDNIRDYINLSSWPVYKQMAAAGLKFDLMLDPKVGIDNYMGWASTLQQSFPGSVVALEGPNEVDKQSVTFNGLTGYAGAIATQKALFARAEADPTLHDVPVYNLSLAGIDPPEYEAVGDLSAYADFGNIHSYYQAGQQSWGYSQLDPNYTLQAWIESSRWSAPGRPTVITETGSTASPGSVIGVTEEVQAKQILNSLLAGAKHGIAATYLYELVGSNNADPTNIESHYGLFRPDWTPKPAAQALHNFTHVLTSSSGEAGAPAAPAYTVHGLPETGSSLLFQEDDGAYDIVVWAEPDLWDQAARAPITAPDAHIDVSLGGTYAGVLVYDPMASDQPVQTFSNVSSVALTLVDHPLIIEVRGAAGAAPPSSPAPAPSPEPAPTPAPAPSGGGGVDWIGTDRNDYKVGTDGADTLSGLAHTDILDGGKGDDVVDGGSENDTLFGGAGDDSLLGGAGRDILSGGAGDDILTGGSSEVDFFVMEPGGGHDVVTDFTLNERVDMRPFRADQHNYQLTQSEAGALITLGDTSLLLRGVRAASLQDGNFIFG